MCWSLCQVMPYDTKQCLGFGFFSWVIDVVWLRVFGLF